MNNILEFVSGLELSTAASSLLHFIDNADPYLAALSIGILAFFGSRMAAHQPGVRSWGLRLGLTAFLIYGGYKGGHAYFTLGTFDAGQLPSIAGRGLLAAGMTLAATWILLAVLTFVIGHMRLALATFFLYTSYACFTLGTFDAQELPNIALRGLLVTALTLAAAWILQPAIDFISSYLPKPPPRPQENPRAREEEKPPVATAVPASPAWTEAPGQRNNTNLNLDLFVTVCTPPFGGQPFSDGGFSSARVASALEELTRWFLNEQQRIKTLRLDKDKEQEQLGLLSQRHAELAARLLSPMGDTSQQVTIPMTARLVPDLTNRNGSSIGQGFPALPGHKG